MMCIAERKTKKYSKGFKLNSVDDVLVSQMGLRETVRKYGITHKMIQTWIKIYLIKGKATSRMKSTMEVRLLPARI